MNKKETIKRIIEELKKIEKDDEVDITSSKNVVDYTFNSFDGSFAILKNVIEIVSKRPVKTSDDIL